eukprot:scaffold497_cov368-Prasinococcus_capsulatus_cf.AAC.15
MEAGHKVHPCSAKERPKHDEQREPKWPQAVRHDVLKAGPDDEGLHDDEDQDNRLGECLRMSSTSIAGGCCSR